MPPLSLISENGMFPAIDDAELDPTLHGPDSACALAMKRCQAFVLTMLPSWINFIAELAERV